MSKTVTATITRSSHPDFELFASTSIGGRQHGCRGDRARVNRWLDELRTAAGKAGFTVVVKDEA
jgi:hypothetical protein